jgi:uncharacterized cofD-like protein
MSREQGAHIAGLRIVTIGGGTGPFAVLSRLKQTPCELTAIISMADSGDRFRSLMDEFGPLPFGDLRQALVATARSNVLWRDVFTHRFRQGQVDHGIGGHSLGNLIISALQDHNQGDLLAALHDAQSLLDTAGAVLPITLSQSTLCAELADGTYLTGKPQIAQRGAAQPGALAPITHVYLDGPTPALPEALNAIRQADVIIIGPGDLYTSVIPNLLIDGIAAAICASDAQKVFVCNLMTKRGETDGYRASDFVRTVQAYLGCPLDHVILHDGAFPASQIERYGREQSFPIVVDEEAVRALVPFVTIDTLASAHEEYLRHDPDGLMHAILLPHMLQFDAELAPAPVFVNTRDRI